MSKSAIYTVNNSPQALAVGSVINLGSVIRRFGQNIMLDNNTIRLNGAGYYKILADLTVTATNAGTFNISMLKDGDVIATVSETVAAGVLVTFPIMAMVREYGCCCNDRSNITFVISGTAETVSGISVIGEKL